MKVILMERIRNVGSLGDEVLVANGYARNYLIPQGKALRATKESRERFEAERSKLEVIVKEQRDVAQKISDQLADMVVTIGVKASAEGKLYGSVSSKQITEALMAEGVAIQKNQINLTKGALRSLGEHQVEIHLHADVSTLVTIIIAIED